MTRVRRQLLVSSLLASLALPIAWSCKREKRGFRVAPALAEMSAGIPYNVTIRPGPYATTTPTTTQPLNVYRAAHEPLGSSFANNAQAQSDGQMLYAAFNCMGCHAHGGGGMAPPFLDEKWFYGGEPDQVFTSILEGRPNGMPSYRGRIPEYQIWELVAYVRSLSGNASHNAAPGREDHMSTILPPNSIPKESPVKVPEPTTKPATGKVFMTPAPAATRPATTSPSRTQAP
jgi:cytochrome c oxidase cbb3-type subunit 3